MKCENKYETEAWEEHLTYVLGLDEAGRGPIAGPLVVAGVCFPKHFEHEGIYDSKKISEKKREEMFEIIIQEAVYYKIEVVDVEIIDTYNIYRATQMTMEKIVNEFKECEKALSDAMPLPNVVVPYAVLLLKEIKKVLVLQLLVYWLK